MNPYGYPQPQVPQQNPQFQHQQLVQPQVFVPQYGYAQQLSAVTPGGVYAQTAVQYGQYGAVPAVVPPPTASTAFGAVYPGQEQSSTQITQPVYQTTQQQLAGSTANAYVAGGVGISMQYQTADIQQVQVHQQALTQPPPMPSEQATNIVQPPLPGNPPLASSEGTELKQYQEQYEQWQKEYAQWREKHQNHPDQKQFQEWQEQVDQWQKQQQHPLGTKQAEVSQTGQQVSASGATVMGMTTQPPALAAGHTQPYGAAEQMYAQGQMPALPYQQTQPYHQGQGHVPGQPQSYQAQQQELRPQAPQQQPNMETQQYQHAQQLKHQQFQQFQQQHQQQPQQHQLQLPPPSPQQQHQQHLQSQQQQLLPPPSQQQHQQHLQSQQQQLLPPPSQQQHQQHLQSQQQQLPPSSQQQHQQHLQSQQQLLPSSSQQQHQQHLQSQQQQLLPPSPQQQHQQHQRQKLPPLQKPPQQQQEPQHQQLQKQGLLPYPHQQQQHQQQQKPQPYQQQGTEQHYRQNQQQQPYHSKQHGHQTTVEQGNEAQPRWPPPKQNQGQVRSHTYHDEEQKKFKSYQGDHGRLHQHQKADNRIPPSQQANKQQGNLPKWLQSQSPQKQQAAGQPGSQSANEEGTAKPIPKWMQNMPKKTDPVSKQEEQPKQVPRWLQGHQGKDQPKSIKPLLQQNLNEPSKQGQNQSLEEKKQGKEELPKWLMKKNENEQGKKEIPKWLQTKQVEEQKEPKMLPKWLQGMKKAPSNEAAAKPGKQQNHTPVSSSTAPVGKDPNYHQHLQRQPPAAAGSDVNFKLSPHKMNPQQELQFLRKQHEQLKKLQELEQHIKQGGTKTSTSGGQPAKQHEQVKPSPSPTPKAVALKRLPCKFFPRCRNGRNCTFQHPPCRFGDKCKNAACVFDHSVLSVGHTGPKPAESEHKGLSTELPGEATSSQYSNQKGNIPGIGDGDAPASTAADIEPALTEPAQKQGQHRGDGVFEYEHGSTKKPDPDSHPGPEGYLNKETVAQEEGPPRDNIQDRDPPYRDEWGPNNRQTLTDGWNKRDGRFLLPRDERDGRPSAPLDERDSRPPAPRDERDSRPPAPRDERDSRPPAPWDERDSRPPLPRDERDGRPPAHWNERDSRPPFPGDRWPRERPPPPWEERGGPPPFPHEIRDYHREMWEERRDWSPPPPGRDWPPYGREDPERDWQRFGRRSCSPPPLPPHVQDFGRPTFDHGRPFHRDERDIPSPHRRDRERSPFERERRERSPPWHRGRRDRSPLPPEDHFGRPEPPAELFDRHCPPWAERERHRDEWEHNRRDWHGSYDRDEFREPPGYPGDDGFGPRIPPPPHWGRYPDEWPRDLPPDREQDFPPHKRLPHERGFDYGPLADDRLPPPPIGRGPDDVYRDDFRGSPSESHHSHSRAPLDDGGRFKAPPVERKPATPVESILDNSERNSRPDRIVIILRGPPGSGKTHVARLIKDKEVSCGAHAPRILALDDYFLSETEKTETDPETGKRIKRKVMEYIYEAEMEEAYRASLFKVFSKTLEEGFFPMVIVDAIHSRVDHFSKYWSHAKEKGFQVYVAELMADAHACAKRNSHHWSLEDISKMVTEWEETPAHYLRLDVRSLLQDAVITEVEMEAADEPKPVETPLDEEPAKEATVEPEMQVPSKSKWEDLDSAQDKLNKLDGIRPMKRRRAESPPLPMLDDDDPYDEREEDMRIGKKRVRWADIEEKKNLEHRRRIGFCIGTDWSLLTDPNAEIPRN